MSLPFTYGQKLDFTRCVDKTGFLRPGHIYKKQGNKPNYVTTVAMHKLTRVIYKFILTFGKLMGLAT